MLLLLLMLSKVLDNIGTFSQEQILMLEKESRMCKFAKGDHLLKEGEIGDSIYLILSGAAYQFKADEITEMVIELYTAGTWCFNAVSFSTMQPSLTSIVAYLPCSTLQLSVTTIHTLIGISPAFLQLGKILNDAVSRACYYDGALSPSEKWRYLSKTRPDVVQHFPLKMIASYLKITPETLSRVRSHK